jgi:biotin transport system substrate-specific component
LSTPALAARRPAVLGDALPLVRGKDVVLVLAGALLTVLGAQISIHVPPSPVPVTGQTLGVVIAGAGLGARRGAASQLLYVVLGLFLPVYADGDQGWHVVTGASGGYLIGFVLAAWAIGRLAELGTDRKVPLAIATFIVGQLIVFGIGVPWLKAKTSLDWSTAIHEGFSIFIVGGLIKAAVAGVATPAAWRLVRRVDRED